jgi:hypothetical protein
MSERPSCPCLLCRIEEKLFREIDSPISRENYEVLHSVSPPLVGYPQSELLLAHLRAGRGDASSDQILLELMKWCDVFHDGLVPNLFLLAFLPMLHATVRQVTRRHPSLMWDDAAQQSILVFLEFLHSAQFRRRISHLAFALARRVKRGTYAWAQQETASREPFALAVFPPALDEDSFERLVLLRHLLDRATARAVIDTADLQLLVQIKLDGEPGEVFYEELGLTPNAFRQRVKRLLAKLRRMAATKPGSPTRGGIPKELPDRNCS